MSEITKLLSAAALIAAGFFGAAMFGSPNNGNLGSGTGGDWTPTALQPLQASAQPSTMTPHPTWDTSVVATGHVSSDPYTRAAGESFSQHEVARPSWQPQEVAPASPPNLGPPAIQSNPAASFQADERFASFAPPALLESTMPMSPMQSSGFPERPIDASPPAPTMASSPGATNGPSLAPASGWLPPVVSPPPPAISAQPVGQFSEPARHVVKDGDTLAKIAERYLGDANRARELYELNQDKLSSPDLLPIGAELQIPQASQFAPTQPPSPINVYDAAGAPSASYVPQSRLMPLPELPDSVRFAPRARLQPPVSATLVGTGP